MGAGQMLNDYKQLFRYSFNLTMLRKLVNTRWHKSCFRPVGPYCINLYSPSVLRTFAPISTPIVRIHSVFLNCNEL